MPGLQMRALRPQNPQLRMFHRIQLLGARLLQTLPHANGKKKYIYVYVYVLLKSFVFPSPLFGLHGMHGNACCLFVVAVEAPPIFDAQGHLAIGSFKVSEL